ncbi:hypothetical protein [Schinkia azotoformans]|uniref:hypothetical protein n=1 Tax=Schinkia azotoformans TaxID=1454 RepID=UPI002DBAA867|nr:hypothetical protein [Schinkia azotoformans]MEC1717985.1 hypothetical protein [Schinkia azotoformans]MEC1743304.1 hypothetical protein [Schinkia azotoformans]MEC1746872.1 hypothetical protein [Schinkia azotoformans]MEC1760365.1 hypothetical protein [Schinkia azotoformans]MEC1769223.1 hypothetical protein [Schinkia azotoformans]
MSDYIVLIPLFLGVIAMLNRSEVFSKVVKYISLGYFFVLTVFFILVRERIYDLYHKGSPIPDIYWEKNSNWADIGMFLYLVPTAVIFLILCLTWFKREKDIKWKILMFLFFVVGAALLFGYSFIFSLSLGYVP